MIFNDHSNLNGSHAFLSGSKSSWLNYEDTEQLITAFVKSYATTLGTVIHELAALLINKKIKLDKTDIKLLILYLSDHGIPDYIISNIDTQLIFSNLVNYVNDAISYGMQTEKKVVYSTFCYGTADAIEYYPKKKLLRIHDLKTGSTPVHIEQLMFYAAVFCLEYNVNPKDIKFELRIYQNDDALICKPTTEEITDIISKIKLDNEQLETFVLGGPK